MTAPGADPDQVLFCARCTRPLRPGRGGFYRVRIDATADPAPPAFDPEELERDLRAEIAGLIDVLRDVTEQEAKDQVHRRMEICLCDDCFGPWIEDPA